MIQDKPSLKIRIVDFAKEKYPNWINGGEYEVFSISLGFKASNGSRRCRELADEGTFERRMNGKSVEYRYLQKEVQKNPAPAMRIPVVMGQNLINSQRVLTLA